VLSVEFDPENSNLSIEFDGEAILRIASECAEEAPEYPLEIACRKLNM
jgi:hypothetical protein